MSDLRLPDGERIKRLREAKGWSQLYVVAKSKDEIQGGFSEAWLSLRERGERGDEKLLRALANVLGVPSDEIIVAKHKEASFLEKLKKKREQEEREERKKPKPKIIIIDPKTIKGVNVDAMTREQQVELLLELIRRLFPDWPPPAGWRD